MTEKVATNREFGERVGVHYSMASRIRAGKRLPGIDVLEKIGVEFQIPVLALLAARSESMEAFGALMRERCFDPPPAPVRAQDGEAA